MKLQSYSKHPLPLLNLSPKYLRILNVSMHIYLSCSPVRSRYNSTHSNSITIPPFRFPLYLAYLYTFSISISVSLNNNKDITHFLNTNFRAAVEVLQNFQFLAFCKASKVKIYTGNIFFLLVYETNKKIYTRKTRFYDYAIQNSISRNVFLVYKWYTTVYQALQLHSAYTVRFNMLLKFVVEILTYFIAVHNLVAEKTSIDNMLADSTSVRKFSYA